jgi:hypothetical protein
MRTLTHARTRPSSAALQTGTGKTSTIVHAIQALAASGASVLVSAYTNSAVDNILLKLAGSGCHSFLRLGRAASCHAGVHAYMPGGARCARAQGAATPAGGRAGQLQGGPKSRVPTLSCTHQPAAPHTHARTHMLHARTLHAQVPAPQHGGAAAAGRRHAHRRLPLPLGAPPAAGHAPPF